MKKVVFKKKGMMGSITAVISLVIGIIVATVVIIFGASISAKTYSLTSADIDAISNSTIKGYVQNGVASAFQAQASTGQYLPLVVLGFIVVIILSMIVGLMAVGPGRGGGGAL